MNNPKKIRLQKVIADAGLASRREAELWIRQGLVEVNRSIATIGQSVDPSQDSVTVNGTHLPKAPQTNITLAMNKPRGFVCTHKDPYQNRTIFELLPKEYRKLKFACAGRLDKDTEGLLILTTDGPLANKISHPSHQITKRYTVTLSKPFDTKLIPKLLRGIRDSGELLHLTKIVPAKSGHNKECRLEVHLAQGRKREIRRLFEAFGYYVNRLKRFQIGRFTLKKIASGKVKPLNNDDLNLLLKK